MNENDLILKSLDIIIEEKVWEDKKPSEILRILMYLHSKGWLFFSKINGEIKAILSAYRINEVTDDSLKTLPVDENGHILYVPFVLSLNKNENLFHIIREATNIYLKDNPDIEEIVLEDKNNQIKRYSLKGALNGKK